MELAIVLGWTESDATDVLQCLGAIPQTDPYGLDEDFNPVEFAVSDEGIEYINDKLSIVNSKFNTYFEWVLNREDFVLVWRYEFKKNIGDPNDEPSGIFYANTKVERPIWLELSQYDLPCKPQLIIVYDATSYYHQYLYDHDSKLSPQ